MRKDERPDDQVADIVSTLVVLNRGNFIIDAGRELKELTDAIKQTNAKGKITITLDLTPSGWKEDGRCNQVDIKPKIGLTKPKPEQGKSIFFLTEDNKLVRDDPDQEKMFADPPLEVVSGRR